MTGPTTPEIRPLGVDGVLVRFARTLSDEANRRAVALRDALRDRELPGVTEIAPSLTSVRVGFDPAVTDRATITAAVQSVAEDLSVADAAPHRLWQIPVAFGQDHAPQLADAASLAGLTPEAAVTEIEAQTVRVIAIGFAPGQPYLGMLPPHWDIPRQSDLTESMPRGALVVAVRQLIIFAADAPTGWRHIGQTAFRVYRPEAAEPFAFEPGDAVQFRAVSDSEFIALRDNPDSNGGATCRRLD